ncbi:MAG: hypothetical protein IJE21_06360 [Alistipes sp.]|nr:hypothetical protein [Alistipes sp.]
MKKVLKSGFFDPARHRERVFFGRGACSAKSAKSGQQRWGYHGVRAGKKTANRTTKKQGKKTGKNAQENGKEKTTKTEKKEGA